MKKQLAAGASAIALIAGAPLAAFFLTQPGGSSCRAVPAKMWGGVWHYSPAILKPTRIETYCVTYPHPVGAIVTVSVAPVAP